MRPSPVKLISGMHRTGTSLIAQVCWRAGGDLGNADEFYRPDQFPLSRIGQEDGIIEEINVRLEDVDTY